MVLPYACLPFLRSNFCPKSSSAPVSRGRGRRGKLPVDTSASHRHRCCLPLARPSLPELRRAKRLSPEDPPRWRSARQRRRRRAIRLERPGLRHRWRGCTRRSPSSTRRCPPEIRHGRGTCAVADRCRYHPRMASRVVHGVVAARTSCRRMPFVPWPHRHRPSGRDPTFRRLLSPSPPLLWPRDRASWTCPSGRAGSDEAVEHRRTCRPQPARPDGPPSSARHLQLQLAPADALRREVRPVWPCGERRPLLPSAAAARPVRPISCVRSHHQLHRRGKMRRRRRR